MPGVATFEDFDTLTGPAEASALRAMVNDATRPGGRLIARMMLGSGGFYETFQGGNTIQDHIYLNRVVVRKKYSWNDKTKFSNPQVTKKWSIPWRQEWTHWAAADGEFVLSSESAFNSGDRFQQFKAVKWPKLMNMMTDFIEGHEEDLWLAPDFSGMESADGKLCLSIPVFCNEYPSGLYTADESGTWTTKQGLDPVANPSWDNQRATAVAAGGDAHALASGAGDSWTYWEALDSIYEDLDFQRLPKFPEYDTPKTKPKLIACSKYGINHVRAAMRKSNDRLVYGPQDPAYPAPMFNELPFVRCGALDGAAIFPDDAAAAAAGTSHGLTDEENAGSIGPRYFLLDLEHIKKAWHRNRFMFRKRVTPQDQIWSHAVAYDTYTGTYGTSLRRQGLVYPAGDIS